MEEAAAAGRKTGRPNLLNHHRPTESGQPEAINHRSAGRLSLRAVDDANEAQADRPRPQLMRFTNELISGSDN